KDLTLCLEPVLRRTAVATRAGKIDFESALSDEVVNFGVRDELFLDLFDIHIDSPEEWRPGPRSSARACAATPCHWLPRNVPWPGPWLSPLRSSGVARRASPGGARAVRLD